MPGDSPSADRPVSSTQVVSGYVAPTSLDEALALLGAGPEIAVIAGGTDLVPAVRAGRREPSVIVDLRHLGLSEITVEADQIRIGAAVTFTEILGSVVLATEYPALLEAASEVGGPPIRNRATLGGNLANASPAADSAPPLLVYDASVVIAGPAGRREVPLTAFFEGPGRTVLRPGEILIEVVLPRPAGSTRAAFYKLGPRLAMAIAIVSVAVRVTRNDAGEMTACRIALGAVAPIPLRMEDAETIISSEGLTTESIVAASAAAARACSPIDDIRGTATYRRQMVEVLVGRLLTRLLTGGDGRD